MVDLERARQIVADLHGLNGKRPIIIVDNTMLGPIYQIPLAHGADRVVTSLTKYIGGHSDLIAGGCSGAAAVLEPIRGVRTILGTMCDPHRLVADALMRDPEAKNGGRKGRRTQGRSFPQYSSEDRVGLVSGILARGSSRSSSLRAPMQEFRLHFHFRSEGGEAEAFAVQDRLKVIKFAVSLGSTETLASHPAAMTHSDIRGEGRLRVGSTPALIRISVGIAGWFMAEHPGRRGILAVVIIALGAAVLHLG